MKITGPIRFETGNMASAPFPGAFTAGSNNDGLTEAGRFLRRHWFGIAASALMTAAAAGYMSQQLDPLYRSQAQILVQPTGGSPLEEQVALQAAAEASYIDSQIYILKSADLLIQVLHDTGLIDDRIFGPADPGWLRTGVDRLVQTAQRVTGRQAAVTPEPATDEDAEILALRRLREMLDVAREGDSYVLTTSVTAPRPDLAALLANSVVSAYINLTLDQRVSEASQSAEWLAKQAAELQTKLQQAENAVEEFRASHGLLDDGKGGTLNQQQLSEINVELIRTRAALAEKRAALDIAAAQITNDADELALPEVLGSDVLNSLRSQLLELSRERAAAGDRLINDARLALLDADVAQLEQQVSSEVRRIVESLRTEVRTLEVRESLLLNELQDIGGQTEADQRVSGELRALERQAATYQDLYQRYLSRAQVTQEAASFLGSGPRIVSRALASSDPVFPPNKVIVIFGFLLGAGLFVLYALLRERLRKGFGAPRDVEAVTGLPVVARFDRPRRGEGSRALRSPHDCFREAARALRLSLAARSAEGGAPVVLVTSSLEREGGSAVLLALARSAAATGKRVLLIDADLQRRALSELLGRQRQTGLSDVADAAAAHSAITAVPDPSGNLALLPAGPAVDEPDRVLESPLMSQLLQQAREEFDLVLLDGPPILGGMDAIVLSRLADAVVLVVCWKKTPQDAVRHALSAVSDRALRLALSDGDSRRATRLRT